MQIKSGDDEATMSYGRSELSEFDAESEEDKQHLQVNCTDHCKCLNGVGLQYPSLHVIKLRFLASLYLRKHDLFCSCNIFSRNEQDVISLLAYPRPEISPLRHLIQPSRRQAVADSLNQAILSMLHGTFARKCCLFELP